MSTNSKSIFKKQPQLLGDIINQILRSDSPFACAMRARKNNIVAKLLESVTVKTWELAGNAETSNFIFGELSSKNNEIRCNDIVIVVLLAVMEKYGKNMDKYGIHGKVAHQANKKLEELKKGLE